MVVVVVVVEGGGGVGVGAEMFCSRFTDQKNNSSRITDVKI